ncbi:MAG: glycosyltransferase family 4 protein, partial [Candidatus Heimdallarchaeota archaeon]
FPSEGLEIVRLWNTRIKFNAYYFALPGWRLIRALRQADFVILHSLMPLGVAGGLLAKLFRKKVGLFCHHDERVILQDIVKVKPPLVRFLYRLIRNFYSKVVDVFFHATERFKKKLLFFDVNSERIFHTPFAINQKSFHPEPEINLHLRHNLPEDAIIATYLGRLSVEKNIDTILQAMDTAMNELPNLYSFVVGGGPDEDKVLSQTRNNADRFIFTGFIPENELQSHYASSDIFVTPTLNESSCFTVFEAMTCRVPIITAEMDHDPDIIHGKNALLINDVLDHTEIAENILRIAKDKELCLQIADNGHRLIDSRTWVSHAQKFMAGIDEVSLVLEQQRKKRTRIPIKTPLRERRFLKRLRKVSS